MIMKLFKLFFIVDKNFDLLLSSNIQNYFESSQQGAAGKRPRLNDNKRA